jgi:hypothetical protein
MWSTARETEIEITYLWRLQVGQDREKGKRCACWLGWNVISMRAFFPFFLCMWPRSQILLNVFSHLQQPRSKSKISLQYVVMSHCYAHVCARTPSSTIRLAHQLNEFPKVKHSTIQCLYYFHNTENLQLVIRAVIWGDGWFRHTSVTFWTVRPFNHQT